MDDKFGKDLTVGSVPRHLWKFSVPMLLSNLISSGYGVVNTIWVGNIAGTRAVGATAVCFPIIFLLIAIASGATMATTILVSQHFGSKDYNMVERVINNSFTITLILSVGLTIAGILLSDTLLRLVKTPPEVFVLASGYLKITLSGFILMYFSYLLISILRGIGDTVTPLTFMVVGIIINAVLDPLLIAGVWPFPRFGLNGAALATVTAQLIAFASGVIYLSRKKHLVSLSPKKFAFDKHIIYLIFKIGLPSIVQQSLVAIGALIVNAFVNVFGAVAISAFGAASKIDTVAFLPAMSVGNAAATLTGQNLGANKPERVKEIFKWGIIMTCAITLVISLVAVCIPGLVLEMFGFAGNAEGLNIGITYLRIVGSSYILFAVMFVAGGIINGAGHTFTTMLLAILALWLVRIPFALILSHTRLGLTGIWIAIDLSFAVAMAAGLTYYFSGKWKNAVINSKKPA